MNIEINWPSKYTNRACLRGCRVEWCVAIPGMFSSRSIFRESLFFVLIFFVLLCHNKKDGVGRVSVVCFIPVKEIFTAVMKSWNYFPL